jgi:hypothetical protein
MSHPLLHLDEFHRILGKAKVAYKIARRTRDFTDAFCQVNGLWAHWSRLFPHHAPPPERPVCTRAEAVRALEAFTDCVNFMAMSPLDQFLFHSVRTAPPRPAGLGGRAKDPHAAGIPEGAFLDFPTKRRNLLDALRNKGKVPIAEVLRAVYGTASRDGESKLSALVKNTNKALPTRGFRLEISRKGDTLELRRV